MRLYLCPHSSLLCSCFPFGLCELCQNYDDSLNMRVYVHVQSVFFTVLLYSYVPSTICILPQIMKTQTVGSRELII